MLASFSNFLFGSGSLEAAEEVVEVELMTSALPHSDWELVDKVDVEPTVANASMPDGVTLLQVSPLENALIEHPSMSVYHPTKSKKPRCLKPAKAQRKQTVESPRRACAVAARVGLLIDAESQRISQRVAQSVAAEHMTRKQCEKVNKRCKVAARGSQQNRNNRPCGSLNKRAC